MRIRNIEVALLTLPLVGKFSISSGVVSEKETVIIKLISEDGLVGYGESSTFTDPVFTGETGDDVVHAMCNLFVPRVIRKDFETPDEFVASYSDIVSHYAARNGLECAFWHLYSQYTDKPLRVLFNGNKNQIPVGESIGLKDTVEETLEEVELRLSQGYQRIKLKIKPGWDIKLVEAVRHRWPAIDLTVDANTAYTLDKDLAIMSQLDTYNLSMIEQPFAAKKLLDHAALQKRIKTPICLDESIQTVADLKVALSLGACKIVNIKPVRVGGIIESIKIHDYALSKDIGVWCGGMLETGIGRAFNIALASKSNFVYPADMSPYQFFFQEDLIEPSYTVDKSGHISVPTKPGLGFNVRTDVVEKYTIYKVIV